MTLQSKGNWRLGRAWQLAAVLFALMCGPAAAGPDELTSHGKYERLLFRDKDISALFYPALSYTILASTYVVITLPINPAVVNKDFPLTAFQLNGQVTGEPTEEQIAFAVTGLTLSIRSDPNDPKSPSQQTTLKAQGDCTVVLRAKPDYVASVVCKFVDDKNLSYDIDFKGDGPL